MKNVAYQSFNMDLIRDDLEEDYVANHIRLKHVNVLNSVVCVVADPSSFLNDEHLHLMVDLGTSIGSARIPKIVNSEPLCGRKPLSNLLRSKSLLRNQILRQLVTKRCRFN